MSTGGDSQEHVLISILTDFAEGIGELPRRNQEYQELREIVVK